MGHGGAQGGSAAGAPPVEKFRKDYAALPYSIDSVDLDFNVQTDETLVTSTLKLTPTGGGPLVLDGEDLRLVSAEVDAAFADDETLRCLVRQRRVTSKAVLHTSRNPDSSKMRWSEGATTMEASGSREAITALA